MRLSIQDLSFSYRTTQILHHIDVDCDGPGITALLGPNGSGKTTLIRCIDRILRPSSGDVLIDGVSTGSLSAKQLARLISYVPQKMQMSAMRVFDAVLLGRVPHLSMQVSDHDMYTCIEILERTGLSSMMLKSLHELSGGELQKVSIARALAQQAPIMLLDEPTASLDLRNQLDTLKLLTSIAEEQGIMVIIAIHDLNTAFQFAQRFLFMKEGRIIETSERGNVTSAMIEQVYDVPVELQWISKVPHVTPRIYREQQPCQLS
ncbi:MAG: ABC transporter ATP-binding protein [Spirochaetia bacterium]|nr:ABC transporter ATP-binding protein [Spirochaetia bacterium]MCF7940771.1 ABC transporter ATP-binding protein [Spirochaetia bacterium]